MRVPDAPETTDAVVLAAGRVVVQPVEVVEVVQMVAPPVEGQSAAR